MRGTKGKHWTRKDKGSKCPEGCICGKHLSPPNKKEPVVRQCHYPGCENIISTPPSLARIKGCSKSHYKIPKSDHAYGHTWVKLRKLVYERDNYTCKICGKTALTRPQAHHLDHDPENGAMANLVMLCSGCHQGGHRRGLWPIELATSI